MRITIMDSPPKTFEKKSTTDDKESLMVAIIGCIAGSTCILMLVITLWCVWRKKLKKAKSYEIIDAEKTCVYPIESTNLVTKSVGLKQIPFTVPTQGTPPSSRRHDSRFQEESNYGGGSEPASPTGKRPSVEIPGAYALGSIDPTLYRICDEDDIYEVPRDHIGRVWFAVEYERETEKLLVTLIKARNLPSRCLGSDNGCDPFVRIYLIPDERRYLQSKFRKKTCNPKFEESFVFQVSLRSVEDRVLKLTVFDVDRHKRHNVLGHALYPLRDHDCQSNERVVVWRDLEKEVLETATNRGELSVSTSYNNHLERVTVGIFEAKDFKMLDGANSLDYYVKVCLTIQNKVIKTKKSEIIRKTSCPTFNESFNFKLPVNSLDTASITLTAMQHLTGHKDKVVGRITFGSFMFARGKELEHWNEMIANQKEQITHWHVLT